MYTCPASTNPNLLHQKNNKTFDVHWDPALTNPNPIKRITTLVSQFKIMGIKSVGIILCANKIIKQYYHILYTKLSQG